MIVKSEQDEIQSFLADASNMKGGRASRVPVPASPEEVAETLERATRERTPVSAAGAGTGIVGGRVPFGGVVLSTERLNRIAEIVRDDGAAQDGRRRTTEDGEGSATEGRGGRATAGAGVVLAEFQREVKARGLFYPPDPTETSCYLGGTVATNASGARTFKYGPTRRYVRRLKIALATGDLLDRRRGRSLPHPARRRAKHRRASALLRDARHAQARRRLLRRAGHGLDRPLRRQRGHARRRHRSRGLAAAAPRRGARRRRLLQNGREPARLRPRRPRAFARDARGCGACAA